MNFVCIDFELGDKMLTVSSMENLIVQCNVKGTCLSNQNVNNNNKRKIKTRKQLFNVINKMEKCSGSVCLPFDFLYKSGHEYALF